MSLSDDLMREAAKRRAQSRPLDAVLGTFRAWLHFPDADLLYLNVAAYLANRMPEGDPVWVVNVGGSSRGKTELLAAFAGLPDVRVVGSLTEAALLSGTPHKQRTKRAKGGLLRELPEFGATLVVKDFGSILTLPRERRAIVVQALRDVYDGRYVRDVGTGGGERLEWKGRLGLLAGATGTLDTHHSIVAALGERWLTLRLQADRADVGRRKSDTEAMARRALAGSRTQEMRETLAAALCGYLELLDPPELRDLDATDADLLVALSVLATTARSPVERHPYSREIELVPQGEGPGRLARQLHKLLLCLYELGLDADSARGAVRRLALDSITPTRRQALEFLLEPSDNPLLEGRPTVTSRVAVELGLPTNTVRRVLEDLAAHGLLNRRKTSSASNAPDEWWPTARATDLWRRVANPHEQAESRVPGESPSHDLREQENIDDDFTGTRSGVGDGSSPTPREGEEDDPF